MASKQIYLTGGKAVTTLEKTIHHGSRFKLYAIFLIEQQLTLSFLWRNRRGYFMALSGASDDLLRLLKDLGSFFRFLDRESFG